MKQIIENINRYKLKSADPLRNQQITYIPTIDDDQVEYSTSNYLISGNRDIIDISCQACLKLRRLKLQPMPARKYIKYQSGIWFLEELIDDKVVSPFMLFINGVFIPWETIKIATAQEQYYIVIDLSANDYEFYDRFVDVIRDIKFAQIITLPNHVEYRRNDRVEEYDTLFAFNDFGELDMGWWQPFVFKCNEREAHHIWFTNQRSTGWSKENTLRVSDDTSRKITKDNIFLFIDGKLATGNKENIRKAFDSNYKDEKTGKITPCLEFVVSEEELEKNPTIKVDSELVSVIADEYNEDASYTFCIFANEKYTETADNIARASLDALEPIIADQNTGKSNPEYLQNLQKPFEMEMSRKKKYDDNVADCIKTMMSYNSSFFNSVYKENSNLVIEEHDGQWLLDKLDLDGTVKIPRMHSEMIDEYIMMLVNGEMYQYYRLCYYYANSYVIPVQNISPDDTIELFRFQNVCNGVNDIIIEKDDGFKNLSPELINENMVLFSPLFFPNEAKGEKEVFDFPPLYDETTGEGIGLQHFPVEYKLETNEDGLIKITLENEKYYGQKLKVAYKNRFQHFWYNLQETTDKYTVDLGDKFMYCNEYSKYLVFYNGRRLASDHYRLTLPVRPTTPFYKFDIYLAIPVHEGDRLDIVYVPSLMQDVIMTPDMPISGDIVVDKSLINYGLSTDLYMLWINGKKIPKSHIKDINSTHLRVTHNENSTKTLCVTKYIPDIDVLSNVFKDNEALWDKITAKLTTSEINTLLGINVEEFKNEEENIYQNAIDIKAIMFELIREQYMMNPRVDITGPFVYDYQDVDKTAIDGYDSADNAILPTADSNRSDNLSNVKRQWP